MEPTAEPTVIPKDETSLARPHVPTDVNELAALEVGRGVQIVEQRAQILETLRMASIKLTMPNDWTLFKSPEDVITGFLGDQGCDRVKKLWGIQVQNLGRMEEIRVKDSEDFAFRITGDGVCGMTGEAVFEMEGVRYSTEHYAQQKPDGLQRVVAVQKAARANLDGGITRELTGLKSVPLSELEKGWLGTGRTWKECNKGRGFGDAGSRRGAESATHGLAPADHPICDACVAMNPSRTTTMVYKAEGKDGPYWFCPKWKDHEKVKSFVNHAKYVEQLGKRNAAATTRQPGEDE